MNKHKELREPAGNHPGIQERFSTPGVISAFPFVSIRLDAAPSHIDVLASLQRHVIDGPTSAGTLKFVVTEANAKTFLHIGPTRTVDTATQDTYDVHHRDLFHETFTPDEDFPELRAAGFVTVGADKSMRFSGGSDSLGNLLSRETSEDYVRDSLTPLFAQPEV